MHNSLEEAFHKQFARAPTIISAAPGRVNLMGEHTDYNGGAVLPLPLPLRTTVALAPRADAWINVHTLTVGASGPSQRFQVGAEQRQNTWVDYVQGVSKTLRDAGYQIGGADVCITSTVPFGSGLSSSAALCVALLRALREAYTLTVDDVTLARLAQRCENDFVGAHVGIMDQMAASVGTADAALHLNTADMTYTQVSLPTNLGLAVINSGISHSLVGGDYNARRRECEAACQALRLATLCDAAFGTDVTHLPSPLQQRARHVISEHARVSTAVQALQAADTQALGRLFNASHASQRDDFAVSTSEVDTLIDVALRDTDVLGARLTGGGFGGCIVAVLARPGARDAAARIAAAFNAATGGHATPVFTL